MQKKDVEFRRISSKPHIDGCDEEVTVGIDKYKLLICKVSQLVQRNLNYIQRKAHDVSYQLP